MKQRIITGAILLAVLIPALYIGGIFFAVVAVLFAIVACNETLNLFKKKYPLICIVSLYALFAITTIVLTLFNPSLLFLFILIMLSLLLIYLVCVEQFSLENVGVILIVFTLFEVLISVVVTMHQKQISLLMMMIIATYTTDAFCLFGGKAFGKHKLIVRISPNKTIEGAISGWLIGAIASFTYAYFRVTCISFSEIIVLTLFMPIFAQFGDLIYSAIKRQYGIKDFGWIFPGHGGVLDRIDSLSFVAVLYLMISYLF